MFWRDLRYGARALRHSPGFALTSILTLGLGIGTATAIFSVVEGVLLRALPYPDAGRIVRLYQLDERGRRNGNVSDLNFEDWQRKTRSFSAMAEMAVGPATTVLGPGEPELVTVTAVSNGFFDVMQVRPRPGRVFAPNEQREGGAPAAVVSDAYWTRSFGQGTVLGDQVVRLRQQSYRIVGVMPPGFDYPAGTTVWIPRELSPPERAPQQRTAHNYQVVARLADGVALDSAIAELSAVSRAMKAEHGDGTWMSDAVAVPLLEQLTATARPTLQLLFGASLLLLVIACTNVSNLLLARGASRRRDMAVQLAIGAARWRLVRQNIAETLVLCFAGCGAGLLLANAAVRALVRFELATLPRLGGVELNWLALLFAAGVSIVTGVLLGVVTAWHGRNTDVRQVLSDGARSATGGRGGPRAPEALVVVQVAVTLVLLAGTALLARSFIHLLSVDPGFRTDDAFLVDLTITRSTDPSARLRQVQVQDELLARLERMPGVTDLALTSGFPLGGGSYANGQFLEMTRHDELKTYDDVAALGPAAKERAGQAELRVVSEGYFRVMGIPLLRGRSFEAGDAIDAPHVAIVSQSLAEAKWPNQDPLGRYIQFGNMDGDRRGLRIVGVVGDVREFTFEALPGPIVYESYRQRPGQAARFSLVVRGRSLESMGPAIQRAVREVDPQLPIRTRTLDQALDRAMSGRRFNLLLVMIFGAAALVLASLGTYGVIAYQVTQQRREISIRRALGAQSWQLCGMVVGRGALLAGIGTGIGLLSAMALGRVIEGMLFGVAPTDPVALAWGVATIAAAVVLACYLPARRAMRIDPALTLRDG
jgi:predicted permease